MKIIVKEWRTLSPEARHDALVAQAKANVERWKAVTGV